MDPKDAEKTAFGTPFGHYQYRRLPMGLKGAPACFQRLMDRVLIGIQGIKGDRYWRSVSVLPPL
jgi:hypothetical protein